MEYLPKNENCVGIDGGAKVLAACSDGISYTAADATLNSLLRKFFCKEQRHEHVFLKAESYFSSTQLCPHCGYHNTELNEIKRLKIREWECPQCHAHNGRDSAAVSFTRQCSCGWRLATYALGVVMPRSQPLWRTRRPR